MASKNFGAIEAMMRLIFGLGIGWPLAEVGVIFDAGELTARNTWLGAGARC